MKKLLSLLFLSTLLFMISCKDDDEPTPEPTVEEIQQDIHQTFDGFVTCMQGYENGQFSSAVQNFLMMSNGEINEDFAEMLTDELGEFDFDIEDFDMSGNSGVYTWSNVTEMWTYVSNTSNTLVFNFPSSSTGSVNNTSLTVNHFDMDPYTVGNNTDYFPTRFLASVEMDGNEIFNIDLDNVTYRQNGDYISPTNYELEIRTAPMTHLFTLHENNTQEFEFNYSSSNDNSCNTTVSLEASTVLSDYVLFEDFEDFAHISGTVGHDALEIRFDVEADNLSNIDDPSVAQINQLVEAKVYLNNSEIGELEVADENDNTIIYIVFNDGTRENVENYVNEDLADELEAVFSNYIEN
jgi:hypothetical protein